ncbi:unnamed protein product [Urochloa humidicola]
MLDVLRCNVTCLNFRSQICQRVFAAPIPPESSAQPDSPVASPVADSPPFSQRPVVVPSSAWRTSHVSVAAVAIVLSIAGFIFV